MIVIAVIVGLALPMILALVWPRHPSEGTDIEGVPVGVVLVI
jgi:hypothetical protein